LCESAVNLYKLLQSKSLTQQMHNLKLLIVYR